MALWPDVLIYKYEKSTLVQILFISYLCVYKELRFIMEIRFIWKGTVRLFDQTLYFTYEGIRVSRYVVPIVK